MTDLDQLRSLCEAASPEAVPALLAEVERLRDALVAALRDAVQAEDLRAVELCFDNTREIVDDAIAAGAAVGVTIQPSDLVSGEALARYERQRES